MYKLEIEFVEIPGSGVTASIKLNPENVTDAELVAVQRLLTPINAMSGGGLKKKLEEVHANKGN